MNLTKQEIAFLITYSDAGRFSSSLESVVYHLLNEGMIEHYSQERINDKETKYYQVSNFGHMMVEKIVNLTKAYSVEVFKFDESRPEMPMVPQVTVITNPEEVLNDNSHYAEEIDDDLLDEIMEENFYEEE